MIKIIKVADYTKRLKATIQATGKLGFTRETADEFNLTTDTRIAFARDDEHANALYMIVCNTHIDDSFAVNRGGKYFYLSTRRMFDAFGYDYVRFNIMFDLIHKPELDEQADGRVYLMVERKTVREDDPETDNSEQE